MKAEIKNSIKELGDHFASLSMEGGSVNSKTKAATIALKAYKEIMEDETREEIRVELLKSFASTVVEMRLQSDVYREYELFCSQQGAKPLGRNEFYYKMKDRFNFSFVRKTDGRFIMPTKSIRLLED